MDIGMFTKLVLDDGQCKSIDLPYDVDCVFCRKTIDAGQEYFNLFGLSEYVDGPHHCECADKHMREYLGR